MVLTATIVMLGLLLILPPLRKNNFYMLHAGLVILTAWYLETHFAVSVRPFHQKILLFLLVLHLIFINLVTFIAYGADKKAAKSGQWRVPESNLHTLEFLGGWIGAVLGQKIFHHKSKKRSYQTFFWAMLIFEIGLIFAILKYLKLI